jgi:formylglycine-generating enzyme required for sulfatase activity
MGQISYGSTRFDEMMRWAGEITELKEKLKQAEDEWEKASKAQTTKRTASV